MASNTLTTHEWNKSVFIGGDIVRQIKQLKEGAGPDLQVHGSGNLIQTLMEHDLVDEFWLKIFPVTLGTGKRLFAQGTIPTAYTLEESKASPRGVIVATLKRAGDVETGSFLRKATSTNGPRYRNVIEISSQTEYDFDQPDSIKECMVRE